MSADEKKMDLDEPVNADLNPEDALRLLLGEERRETDDDTTNDVTTAPE